ncbi:uncharacterized protein LOC103395660 [Cynoglossus semilaevis]|uniref:uncharacterized protein LOC103395660 n=1 Tax=Cynoglossus semilaevis TaxID=244447 RepID=UPI0004961214|nr:uncharacterized protein LOC103395660 [Cynoglossus semilaevis]
MEKRLNTRKVAERYKTGQHLNIEELKENCRHLDNRYLDKDNIPDYPRPEFHVSHLKHDTASSGLEGIYRDGGFRGNDSLLWWSLAVKPEDITAAEARFLEKTFPDRTEEQVKNQESFLGRFATSPAFSEKSRMGSYRFTLSLEQILEAYSQQFCAGAQPVLQVYETVLYKQEVMYVVLVGTKADPRYPSLGNNPNAVCAYDDGRFIWRSQAMCETHRLEMNLIPGEKRIKVELWPYNHQFYVWDHFAVAMRINPGQVLKFDRDELRRNLTYCELGDLKLTLEEMPDFAEAQEHVNTLWPDVSAPLEKEVPLLP